MAIPSLNPQYVVSANRKEKAKKIDAILSDFLRRPVEGLSMLDIGVGTGEIIDFFAEKNRTFGVDVTDQRVSKLSTFKAVANETLPFEAGTFDVVITNHVIEHVLSPENHLREISRVLKSDGIVYLATPNRLFPKETHFKLWLLHYFPADLYFNIAARLGRRGDRFWIFSPTELTRLTREIGFESVDYTSRILAEPKKFHATNDWPFSIGNLFGKVMSPFSPTFLRVLFRSKYRQ